MCHWQTTGNSSVATQTGSTYICDTMTDMITIPMVNLLSEWVCRKYQQVTVTSMTTGNSDIADKTGNSYTTGTTIDSVEISTASQVFLTTASPKKCPQMTTTMSDNRKWYYGPKNGNTYIYWTMRGRMTIPTANMGFSATLSSNKLTPSDCDDDLHPHMII